ncbi:hypothetical protein F4818DRAFT_442464 [Hypoxylon cercidicola]|nr:hypothetical protein F4818DRAFT_442464 [Hypoxylon cercidicola]
MIGSVRRAPAPAGHRPFIKPLTSSEIKSPWEAKLEKIKQDRDLLTEGRGYSDVFEARLGKKRQVYRIFQGPEYASSDPESEYITGQYSKNEVLKLADPLRKMLRYDPAERIHITDVISHPWVQEELT